VVCTVRVAEGNYLLLDYYPWSQLKELFDERWFVQVDVAEAMQVRVPPRQGLGLTRMN
jgi:pantothenate kinase